ncbi:unnamed protein product [Mucor hiemalis]
MSSKTLLFALCIFFALVNIAVGAPIKTNNSLEKRQNESLLRGFGFGLLGVEQGLKSTLNGILNPQTAGSREETIRTADSAGKVVGGAIGTALNNGKLL